jgi:drug/metabolite transporter (DMT)-like permease
VDDLAPIDVALARVALGGATLLAALAVTRTALPRGRAVWGHLFVIALLGNSVPFALLAYGETHVSSIVAGIWNATAPLLVMLVATLMLPEERPTRRRLAGLVGGFAGVLVVLGPWRGLGGSDLVGQLLCFGMAACYGVAWPYIRRHLAGRPESGTSLAAGQMLCATAQLTLATALVGGAPHRIGADTVVAMVALGALGTGVAFIFNYAIVRKAGATTAATVTYLVPVVATVLGVLVLHEDVAWNQLAGAAIVLLSVWASSRPAGAPSSAPPSTT